MGLAPASNLLYNARRRMALFGQRDGRDRTHDATPPQTDGIAPREVGMAERITGQSSGVGGIDAFLGKGTRVSGKLVFEGTGRIEGQVDGEISAQDVLTIGEGAIVKAKVSGATIIVEGQVTGDVIARQRLELRASGRVQGNVTSPRLVVHCSMSGAEAKAAREKPEKAEKAEPATANLDHARETALHVASTLTR
jgi:cytoskeletal protein CcmA (bactofilin family)